MRNGSLSYNIFLTQRPKENEGFRGGNKAVPYLLFPRHDCKFVLAAKHFLAQSDASITEGYSSSPFLLLKKRTSTMATIIRRTTAPTIS